MNKIRNVRRALMLLSLITTTNTSVHTLFDSPFFLDDFFLNDPFMRPHKSLDRAKSDLSADIKALQEEAKRLSKAADELATKLDKNDTMTNLLPSIDTLHDSLTTTREFLSRVGSNIQSVRRAQHVEEIKNTPSYNLQTNTDSKLNVFVVTARLPDAKKEDLKFEVNTSDEFGTERQTLTISMQEKKSTQEKKPGLSQTTRVTQSHYINGRREELFIENGNVSMIVDLPKNVSSNLTKARDTMTFENGILTLHFPLDQQETKRKTEWRFNTSATAQKATISDK